jgi:hypothetical protein
MKETTCLSFGISWYTYVNGIFLIKILRLMRESLKKKKQLCQEAKKETKKEAILPIQPRR